MRAAAIAEQPKGYDAFISYSHAADGSLAPALQDGLQMLAKPLYQRKALRIFRDQTNLSATPELWSTIEQALVESRFFILLASPEAARSPWVQQELDWWHQHRAPEHLLVGLTHGAITWDPVVKDFDWHTTDALPRSLSRWFAAEPLWVDLRWAGSQSALSRRDPRLQEDLATLAAPLRGMSKDDLIGRDLKMHRRAVRLTAAAITLLLLLSVAAGIGAWVATQQRHDAQQQAAIAASRALAAAAISTAPTELDLSLLLAQRAAQMSPAPGTRSSLFQAVSASPLLVRFVPQRSAVTALIARPGGGMIAGHADGTVSLLETAHARQQPLPAAGAAAITALADSGQETMLAGGDAAGTVRLWSLVSRSLRWQRTLGSPVQAIAVSPDALTIAAVLRNNTLVGLDSANGRVRYRVSLGAAVLGQALDHVGFLGNDTVLAGQLSGQSQVWRVIPRPLRLSETGQSAPGDQAAPDAWSSDGRTYAFAAGGGAATVWAATGRQRGSFQPLPGSIDAIAVNDSANQLAYVSDGMLAVRDESTATATAGAANVQLPGFAAAQLLTFTSDGRWLLAGGPGTVAIFNLRQRSGLATELPAQVAPLLCQACFTSLAVDPSGHMVVWTSGLDIVCYDTHKADRRTYPNANPFGQGEVAFTPDGSTLLSYSATGFIGIWPAEAGCPSTVRFVRAGGDNGGGLLLPLDSHRVIAGSEIPATAQLLDLRQGKVVRRYRLPGRSPLLSSAAISSDGRTLAISLSTGNISWFNINSGAILATKGSNSGRFSQITFLPRSRVVAQTTPTAVVLWDPRRGQIGSFNGSAEKLAFSHNGQLLYTLGSEEDIHIWDTASRTLIGSLQGLPLINASGTPVAGGENYGVRTSMAVDDQDGVWLAAASAQPTRWALSPSTWSKLACAWAGRPMTPAEWRQYIGTSPPADLACHA
jgi:WD40 repeat protein